MSTRFCLFYKIGWMRGAPMNFAKDILCIVVCLLWLRWITPRCLPHEIFSLWIVTYQWDHDIINHWIIKTYWFRTEKMFLTDRSNANILEGSCLLLPQHFRNKCCIQILHPREIVLLKQSLSEIFRNHSVIQYVQIKRHV